MTVHSYYAQGCAVKQSVLPLNSFIQNNLNCETARETAVCPKQSTQEQPGLDAACVLRDCIKQGSSEAEPGEYETHTQTH